MNSLHEIADISRHLDQRINEVLLDKVGLLEICGYTPIVGSAVAMSAARTLMQVAIGMWLTQVHDAKRPVAFETALLKLMEEARKNGPGIIAAIRATESKSS